MLVCQDKIEELEKAEKDKKTLDLFF